MCNFNKKALSLVLSVSSCLIYPQIFQISPDRCSCADDTDAKLYYHDQQKKFFVLSEGRIKSIKNQFLDNHLRNIEDATALQHLLSCGKMKLTSYNTGDFGLQLAPGFKGGGPVTGLIAYVAIKAIGYATIGAAVIPSAPAVVATGGVPVLTATVAVDSTATGVGGFLLACTFLP